jgi:hypothetical protein
MNVYSAAIQERVNHVRVTVVDAAHEAVQTVIVEVAIAFVKTAIPVAMIPVPSRGGLDIDEVGLQQGCVARRAAPAGFCADLRVRCAARCPGVLMELHASAACWLELSHKPVLILDARYAVARIALLAVVPAEVLVRDRANGP